MDSIVLLPSVALGVVFVLFYVLRCHQNRESLNLGVIVNTFLLSSGIVCGLLLMAGCIYEPAKAYLKGIDIYIFIGGIAVFVVSAQGIYKDIFSATQK
ncbi:MAG: hypothetical protein Q7U91_10745 [Sideroxyarcus sp.]|nr:hypothetical protein [Sideroxyarcus sp.]